MTEVFRRYGNGQPRPDHVKPIWCVVAHPDAGGPCGREAIGEVWALPFCEVHGREAELAYQEEVSLSICSELDGLEQAERHRPGTNWSFVEALGNVSVERSLDYSIQDGAMEAAYPPEELADNTDADTLRFDYEIHGRDTPYAWWSEARIMAVRFMRQAQCVPIIKELELVRERATVQQLLAERDLDRRMRPAGVSEH